jgi:site-specific DNA-methyltransferase (adenine-specific)
VTQPGDVWLLGNQRLVCGDSTDPAVIALACEGRKARLLHTDPPYGVSYVATKNGIPRSGFRNASAEYGDIANDDLQGEKLQAFLESVFHACLPNLDHPAIYLWHAQIGGQQDPTAAAMASIDALIHRVIIWAKPGFVLTRSGMYHWAHEPCFYGWIRGQQPTWLGDKSQRTIWEIGRDGVQPHPTAKPVELFAIPMRNHLHRGELALEPFAGSGSQVIAAEQLERRCAAIEFEPRYCDVIVARWETLTGRKAERRSG